jgi:TPR repeat protein
MGVNYRDGEGVAVNNVEARKWFHRAAVQGHVEAQCDLGIMIFYALQRGEEDASLDEAEIWLRKAAAAGDKLAEGTLGTTKMFRSFASQQTGRSWDDINND